ncbi:hypothetical protein Tco_1475459 [Tanacetum coccineum]
MARTTSLSTNIEVQMIELVRKEEIDQLEKLSGDPVAAEGVRMLKRVQRRNLDKATHLQIMRSSTGIGAGLGEHLSQECPDKIPIGDRGGFGAWFANQVNYNAYNFLSLPLTVTTCKPSMQLVNESTGEN